MSKREGVQLEQSSRFEGNVTPINRPEALPVTTEVQNRFDRRPSGEDLAKTSQRFDFHQKRQLNQWRGEEEEESAGKIFQFLKQFKWPIIGLTAGFGLIGAGLTLGQLELLTLSSFLSATGIGAAILGVGMALIAAAGLYRKWRAGRFYKKAGNIR